MKPKRTGVVQLLCAVALLVGCNEAASDEQPQVVQVIVRETVEVTRQVTVETTREVTKEVTVVKVATPRATVTPSPTSTPTKTSSPTVTATPTYTPAPTDTATPTITPEGALDLSTCELDAAYVADVTIPDGSALPPGRTLCKTWSVRNTGTCSWTELVALTLVGGEDLSMADSVPLPNVAPGEEHDVDVWITTPEEYGTYRSEWRVCYEDVCFGTPLSVEFRVVEPTATAPRSPTIPRATITPLPGALQGYVAMLNDTGMGTFIDSVTLDGDPDWIKITVRSAWHYEPYQIRLQAAQLLWKIWAEGYCTARDIDSCRIRLVDLVGNEVGGSSWLGGSVIRVDD